LSQKRLNDTIKETASLIVIPIYRKYLEDPTARNGCKADLTASIGDIDFCHTFVQKALDPAFINDSMIARYFGEA
jgi:hypothetical protein